MWTILSAACLCRLKASRSQASPLVLGCIAVCAAAYTFASSLVAYVTFTTAVSVSVFTVKQDREREREKSINMKYSKQRCGLHLHMYIAGLSCCRRWVRHAPRFPWWPREPLVCVNPLKPLPRWLVSRSGCCLYKTGAAKHNSLSATCIMTDLSLIWEPKQSK